MSCRGGGRGDFSRGRGQFSWRGRGRGWRRGSGSRGRGPSRGHSSQASQRGSLNSRAVSQPPRPQLVQTTLHQCPYKKWFMYFPDDVYVPQSPLVEKIEAFKKYFEAHMERYPKDELENDGCVKINYAELIEDQDLKESLPTFAIELRDQPEKTLQCMGLACYQVLSCDEPEETQQSYPVLFDLPYINARVINFEPLVPLKNLKSNYYGKFVSVRGTVVRVSNVKPLVTKMAFSCNICGDIQALKLPDGKYQVPSQCSSSECRGRMFSPLRGSSLTETIDWQNIRVQEIINDDQREAGRIPRTVECELTADLVDSIVPGDMITISGIVKVTSTEESRNKSNKDKVMFLLYIFANSIVSNKASLSSNDSDTGLGADFNIKELYAIQEIQAEKNVFRLLVGSVCPSIYGHELVKAGLLLGLVGGSQKHVDDKNRIPVRGNPHILVVGDPGLGKSQMLQAVSNIAPRGVYVCGNTTSATGLTVTMSKDGSSGDYALEAGALVLGDQGICCIDEFDKMSSQHPALLEAMEQQSISIAKAGIVCSLPARTSIIAAANPVGGHYNLAKTVSENLKMGSPLLSRFDLVFILLDKPDEEMDCMLSEHVMSLHSVKKSSLEKVTVRRNNESDSDEEDEARKQWEADKPLSERLKVPREESLDVIPPQLLRKYVAYARKYVHPKITSGAATAIQNFYLRLRQQHQGADSTPITTRQLESLIRLTEARARLELREKATTRDAEDVIEIMKYSLIDTYSNEYGELDFQRSQHGSGMSAAAQAKRFVAHLSKIADREYNSLFTIEQLKQFAKETQVQVKSLDDFIYSLNNQGFLLKKGARVYQLQTSSCL